MCWGGSGGDTGASEARAEEEARQERIRDSRAAIDTIFNTYDEDFYDRQRDAYLDYATPQVEEQFGDAMRELTFALARSGKLDSALAGRREAKAQKMKDKAMTQVNQQGDDLVSTMKGKMISAKGDLYDQASSLADVDAVRTLAISDFDTSSKPPVYNPITDLFVKVTEGMATQADLERRQKSRYDSGLFSTSDSSKNISG